MRTYSQDVVVKLIGLIYEAALAPEKWRLFLDELGATLDGHGVNLSTINVSDPGVAPMAIARFDPPSLSEYERHYSKMDPWVEAAKRHRVFRPGLVDLGERLVPPHALKKTEFYNDFARRTRFIGGISAIFDIGGPMAALSISQYNFGQFGDSEIQLVQALVPHLQRAVQVHQRLASAETMAANTTSVLDHVRHGVIVVSTSGTVILANRAAQNVLRARDGLLLDRGELRASTPTQTNILRAAIRNALDGRDWVVRSGTPSTALSRPSGRRPLSIVVVSLRNERLVPGLDSAAAAVFVTDPDRAPVTDAEALRSILHLTPSEARLVQCLADGQTLDEAAERLGIRPGTARKRLKVVFHKTGTHRQADLVRLALSCASFWETF